MIVCPRCGNENPDGSKFCSNCGNPLTGIEGLAGGGAADADVPPSAPAASPSPKPATPSPNPTAAPMPLPIPEPRAWSPRPSAAANDPSALPASAPEWRMSDAGPLPEPRRRRTWLWIVLGILGACLLLCVGLTIWGNTESGTRVLNDLATSLAEAGTPGARTPAAGD